MGRGKDGIDLYVAAAAGVRRKAGDAILVAVGAGKGLILNCQLVRFQRESQRLMWECAFAHIRQWSGWTAVFRMAAATGE